MSLDTHAVFLYNQRLIYLRMSYDHNYTHIYVVIYDPYLTIIRNTLIVTACMHIQESFEESDVALMGGRRTIGWISDLAIFHHLVSLSLSDNDLDQFPISLCGIPTLQELDLSRNRIQVIPSEIQLLEK